MLFACPATAGYNWDLGYLTGPIVQRLGHRVLIPVTGVRFSMGSQVIDIAIYYSQGLNSKDMPKALSTSFIFGILSSMGMFLSKIADKNGLLV